MRSLALAIFMTTTFACADESAVVRIGDASTARSIDLGRLLGGNVALWYEKKDLEAEDLAANLDRWKPALLRLPGGSWSDEIYWNGHGVRHGDYLDNSKLAGHAWQVDYSKYAPGFRLSKSDGTLSDFHGHIDVKGLHEYVRDQGAAAMVTVNAGTGSAKMAAEWVKWAKAEGYRVDYWEIGNELDGEWELGHVGPDGSVVDADEYVRRFLEIGKAMKAVDPAIKIGGPAASNDQLPFVEALIRDSGELLDFVTFHTYPVLGGGRTYAQQFAKADDVADAVAKIRGWIKKYQPGREEEIEIGVTEWHKQVMETRPTVDLSSGLWACLFIGAMAESGVDFANQWDYFSDVGSGGHGLFGKDGEGSRAMFHAMMLWREQMGSQLLERVEVPAGLKAFATMKNDQPRVMLVNTTTNPVAVGGVIFKESKLVGRLKAWRFSQREYFWNPHEKRPEWSVPAEEVALDGDRFEVPPFSVIVVSGEKSTLMMKEADAPTLELLLPKESPADLPVEGFVLLRGKDSGAWSGKTQQVKIEIEGVASVEEETVATVSSVGAFQLRAQGPGVSRIKVSAGELSAEATMRWLAVAERDEVLWEFPGEKSIAGLESSFSLAVDGNVRPNQTVAVVALKDAVAESDKATLLAIKSMPNGFARERIGGVIGKFGGSSDLTTDDPRAYVHVVLQSNLDHWLPIGKVPLADLKGAWNDVSLSFNDPRILEAMSELYAVRFHLKSQKPVSGRLYFDDLGFTLRGE